MPRNKSLYKTIQIKAKVKDRLAAHAKQQRRQMGYIVERLIERYLAGHFSGSLEDVIRENAGPEHTT